MGLNRFDADAQVIGDLFVQTSGDDALKHLGFTPGELGQQGFSAGALLRADERLACAFEHAFDQVQELCFLEGFLDEVHGAVFHGLHGHGHVAMTRDEHDGQGRLAFDQPSLELHAVHATHANVRNQASDFARVVAAQEGLGRLVTAHPVVFAFKQPLQRITDGFVIIHDVDRSFFRNQTHSFPSTTKVGSSGG